MRVEPHRRVDRRLSVLRSALAGMGDPNSGDTDSSDQAVVPIAWALQGPFRLRLMLTSGRQHVHIYDNLAG